MNNIIPEIHNPKSEVRRPPAFRLSSFLFRLSPAFTLIELLVVIAIIAVLAGITVPAVKAMSKGNNGSQAANQLRAALSEARAVAIAQHRQAGLVIFDETAQYAFPVNTSQTALQIFVEDYNQDQYTHNPHNTIFVPYSRNRGYLPAGIAVAALNDDPSRGVMVGNEAGSVGKTRAVLFDATGQMITRHGLARPNLPANGTPGAYPTAQGDWNFTTQGTAATDTSSRGISSPGFLLYDRTEFAAQNIATDHSGDAPRNDWLKKNATVILVNANTGALLP